MARQILWKRVLLVSALVVGAAVIAVWFATSRGDRGKADGADGEAASAGRSDTAPGRGQVRDDPRRLAAAAIRGTVRTRGGGPLAGAQVCASWSAEDATARELDEPACTVSDASGAYRLEGLLPGEHALVASAAGHVSARWRPPGDRPGERRLAPAEVRAPVDFALAAGGVEVRGTVADVNGGPVAGARVTLGEQSRAGTGRPSTRADEQGRFLLWAAAGAIRVDATADGYAAGAAEAMAPARVLVVLLTPESSLGGVVVEAGTRAPVADVLVAIGEDRDSLGTSGAASARTDRDGRFRLDRLPPGRYKPTAQGRGVYGEPVESVLLGLGQRVDDLTIEVHPARAVRGRVVIEGVGPAGHARVTLHADDGSGPTDDAADEQGQVELVVTRPGRYQVSVVRAGAVGQDAYPPLDVGERDLDGLTWTMTTGGSVRGVVRTADGAAVADVGVSAETVGAAGRGLRSWVFADSAPDGSFLLTGLVPGNHALRVRSDHHPTQEPPLEVAVVAGKETRTELVLPASGAIAGVVVDSDGKPAAGVHVGINNGPYYRGGRGVRTGEDGRFLIPGVEPGPQRVFAARGWFDKLTLPGRTGEDALGVLVHVQAGATASARLVIESRAGVIAGTVRDDQGRAVADAWVLAAREPGAGGGMGGAMATRWTWSSDRQDPPVVTDVDGRFALRGLAPGAYTLRAFRQGGGEVTAEHVEVGATVALVIRATGSIAGTVRDAAGPVGDFTVRVSDPASGFDRSESFFRTGGRFAVRDLPAGAFVVSVSAARGAATHDVTLTAGEHRTGLAFELAANLTVRGRVVDAASGAPVPGMVMIVVPDKGGDPRGTTTFEEHGDRRNVSGDDGRFEIAGVPPGRGHIEGLAVDFVDSAYGMVHHVVELAGGPIVDVGDVKVAKSARHGDVP